MIYKENTYEKCYFPRCAWQVERFFQWMEIARNCTFTTPFAFLLPFALPLYFCSFFFFLSFLVFSWFLSSPFTLTSSCVSFFPFSSPPHLLERKEGRGLSAGLRVDRAGWVAYRERPSSLGWLSDMSGLWREQVRPALATLLGLLAPDSEQIGHRWLRFENVLWSVFTVSPHTFLIPLVQRLLDQSSII